MKKINKNNNKYKNKIQISFLFILLIILLSSFSIHSYFIWRDIDSLFLKIRIHKIKKDVNFNYFNDLLIKDQQNELYKYGNLFIKNQSKSFLYALLVNDDDFNLCNNWNHLIKTISKDELINQQGNLRVFIKSNNNSFNKEPLLKTINELNRISYKKLSYNYLLYLNITLLLIILIIIVLVCLKLKDLKKYKK